MKEIIPIKKEFIFNTKIGEITDISLDYDYKIKDELIEGNIDISGSYKMTEASVVSEEFFYKIPFSVAISQKIKQDTINLEIDDFKYTFDKDILSTNIDLLLTCEEENIKEEIFNIDNYFEELKQENINKEIEQKNEIEDIVYNFDENNIELENIDNININNITNNITNNIINDEKKYYKYKVYIVRPNDTLDSICNKYNITINELKEYNNTENINIGDKIIIPYINE